MSDLLSCFERFERRLQGIRKTLEKQERLRNVPYPARDLSDPITECEEPIKRIRVPLRRYDQDAADEDTRAQVIGALPDLDKVVNRLLRPEVLQGIEEMPVETEDDDAAATERFRRDLLVDLDKARREYARWVKRLLRHRPSRPRSRVEFAESSIDFGSILVGDDAERGVAIEEFQQCDYARPIDFQTLDAEGHPSAVFAVVQTTLWHRVVRVRYAPSVPESHVGFLRAIQRGEVLAEVRLRGRCLPEAEWDAGSSEDLASSPRPEDIVGDTLEGVLGFRPAGRASGAADVERYLRAVETPGPGSPASYSTGRLRRRQASFRDWLSVQSQELAGLFSRLGAPDDPRNARRTPAVQRTMQKDLADALEELQRPRTDVNQVQRLVDDLVRGAATLDELHGFGTGREGRDRDCNSAEVPVFVPEDARRQETLRDIRVLVEQISTRWEAERASIDPRNRDLRSLLDTTSTLQDVLEALEHRNHALRRALDRFGLDRFDRERTFLGGRNLEDLLTRIGNLAEEDTRAALRAVGRPAVEDVRRDSEELSEALNEGCRPDAHRAFRNRGVVDALNDVRIALDEVFEVASGHLSASFGTAR